MPAGHARVDFATLSNKLANKMADNGAQSGGIFGSFWGKMQSFEFEGEIPTDRTSVMYVKSPIPSYWRGESVDFYTGTGWENRTVAKMMTTGEFDH